VVERIATGFTFTEGPAADAAGDVWFSDVRQSRTHRWRAATGRVELVRENTGGANGLYFDAAGRLLICEGGNRRMTRLEADGSLSVLMDSYQGKRLNSPNDLWVAPGGDVYFSDPRYGDASGLEQDGMHVYLIPADGRAPLRVTDDLKTPNGLIGTVDGRTLYVADAGAGSIWRYAVAQDGTLSAKTLFTERASDGMSLDERGNVYLANGNRIWVHAGDGRLIETIPVPEPPANLTFGGPDRRTLFITARTSLYRIAMKVRGAWTPVEGGAAPTAQPSETVASGPSPSPSATALPPPSATRPAPEATPTQPRERRFVPSLGR
jgi:gluconolactonase